VHEEEGQVQVSHMSWSVMPTFTSPARCQCKIVWGAGAHTSW